MNEEQIRKIVQEEMAKLADELVAAIEHLAAWMLENCQCGTEEPMNEMLSEVRDLRSLFG